MASTSVSPDQARASGSAARRLRRDLENLRRSRNPQIAVMPAEDNLLEWHFVLHSLPSDTPYHEGCYHGKILFPPEYPLAPPALLMVTPSGRLETGKRLCLSMTDFHPESWNPAWSVETILVGLLSFFITDAESGYGAISASAERRKQFAQESWAANAASPEFRALFPRFLDRNGHEEQDIEAGAADGGDAAMSGAAESQPAAEDVPSSDSQSRAAAEVHQASPATSRAPLAVSPLTSGPLSEVTGNITAILRDPLSAAQSKADSPCSVEQDLESGRPESSLPTATPRTTEATSDAGHQESAGFDSETPPAPAADANSDDEDAPTECWICRDNTLPEPLIQPCACRGSMSGVHASCVEQWIRHHRRNAVNDERPRCSVCHQELNGYEQRPGLHLFVRHLCYDAMQQLLRTAVLVVLLIGYQSAAAGPEGGMPLPMIVRVILIVCFSIVAVHKVVVLTVSLPLHRPPPRRPYLRRFFVSDYRSLAMHIAEAFAAIAILAFWCLFGSLDWPFFLPCAVAAAVPFLKMCFRTPSLACLKRSVLLVLTCFFAPFVVTWALLTFLYRHPQRVLHPLDAGWHIGVAIAAVPLCLAYESNVPVITLWGVHSVLVALGLIEIFLVKRWQWREGTLWWCALQLTALSAYVANAICVFPKGLGAPDNTAWVVFFFSSLWLGLVCTLTLATNWALCIRYYRTWQHRHGTFTLQVPADHQAGAR
mmetsp:Transcript_124778/g.216389  ORF Transcript_124778/g.216389 Transcript_124778/m.216389 type:complete len:712 (-) Transcript_124778:48-2183(-)